MLTNYSEMSDRQLVAACRKKDEAAWEALIVRYERLVYSIPSRYGLHAAECDDVFQATWAQLLIHLPKLKQPDRIAAWLVTTAKRLCWDQRRGGDAQYAESTDPTDFPEQHLADTQLPEQLVVEFEQHAKLRQGMNKLGTRCQQLLRSLYFDNEKRSYSELAETLGIAVGAIGPTRARCLKKLRELLN